MSLPFRLVMVGALAVVLALALAALGLSSLFGRHVEQRSLSELSANLDQVLAGLDTSAQGLAILKSPADPRFNQPYSGLYWQIDTPTQSLRSRSLWDAPLRLPVAPGASGTAQTYHLAGPNGQSLLAMARHAKTKVTIGGLAAADQVVLSICDDGPGIPADQRATMLSRFARADEGRSGLGLAIAHEIITLAGGEITLEDAGPGLKILLRLTAGKAAKAFQDSPPDRPRRSS